MTAAHNLFGLGLVIGSLAIAAAAIWSAIAGRLSGGRTDHRHLVDRAVLTILGLLLVAGFLGLLLFLTGSRPADPLHFLYGPASLIALPIAIWIGARRASATGSRVRRDSWTAGGAVVLFGLGLRLVATG